MDQKPDNKMDNELRKAVKNIEDKPEVKSEMSEVKIEGQEKQEGQGQQGHMFSGVQRVMTQNQQMVLQVSFICWRDSF